VLYAIKVREEPALKYRWLYKMQGTNATSFNAVFLGYLNGTFDKGEFKGQFHGIFNNKTFANFYGTFEGNFAGSLDERFIGRFEGTFNGQITRIRRICSL